MKNTLSQWKEEASSFALLNDFNALRLITLIDRLQSLNKIVDKHLVFTLLDPSDAELMINALKTLKAVTAELHKELE